MRYSQDRAILTIMDCDWNSKLFWNPEERSLNREFDEIWPGVNDVEIGRSGWSYMDGLTVQDLVTGLLDGAVQRRKLWPSGEDISLFGLPILSWTKEDTPWITGLLLYHIEVEGIHTYQRIGMFTAHGSGAISRLLQILADTVLIL